MKVIIPSAFQSLSPVNIISHISPPDLHYLSKINNMCDCNWRDIMVTNLSERIIVLLMKINEVNYIEA